VDDPRERSQWPGWIVKVDDVDLDHPVVDSNLENLVGVGAASVDTCWYRWQRSRLAASSVLNAIGRHFGSATRRIGRDRTPRRPGLSRTVKPQRRRLGEPGAEGMSARSITAAIGVAKARCATTCQVRTVAHLTMARSS
jgi:hypothetical protein